jgi:hypothetical protein
LGGGITRGRCILVLVTVEVRFPETCFDLGTNGFAVRILILENNRWGDGFEEDKSGSGSVPVIDWEGGLLGESICLWTEVFFWGEKVFAYIFNTGMKVKKKKNKKR